MRLPAFAPEVNRFRLPQQQPTAGRERVIKHILKLMNMLIFDINQHIATENHVHLW